MTPTARPQPPLPSSHGHVAVPRVDLYAGIHKALRALMTDTLCAIGSMDGNDDRALAEGLQRLQVLLALCQSHLAHENDFVHPALEARASGASSAIAHEHEQHRQDIARLADQASALRHGPSGQRAAPAHALYLQLAQFVGHNFSHMQVEETAHNAVLWAHCSDAELLAIQAALVQSIPPQEMSLTLRWMVPAMNPDECQALFADMQAHAPAPAFAALLDAVRPHLAVRDWQRLVSGLGPVTEVPAVVAEPETVA